MYYVYFIIGPDSGYRARRALHMYIIDLLSGIDPFLNTSNACTFPDTKTRRKLTTPPEHEYDSSLNNDIYEGQYGNFGYGNITVITNETSGRLQLVYGVLGLWNLYRLDNNTFVGQGLDHIWSMTLTDVEFDAFDVDQGVMTTLTIPSFEPRLPPVFVRGLQMSEAYDPEGPCLK